MEKQNKKAHNSVWIHTLVFKKGIVNVVKFYLSNKKEIHCTFLKLFKLWFKTIPVASIVHIWWNNALSTALYQLTDYAGRSKEPRHEYVCPDEI